MAVGAGPGLTPGEAPCGLDTSAVARTAAGEHSLSSADVRATAVTTTSTTARGATARRTGGESDT